MESATRSVGRPREFDGDAVLTRAIELFRARGYHATSVADILQATGLAKASLYGAFGDKHSFFVTTLQRYVTARLAMMREDLDDSRPAVDGIARFLRRIAVEAAGSRGCLTANSALELLPSDAEVATIVAHHQRATQDLLAGAVDRLPRSVRQRQAGSAALALYFFTVVEGLWELGRTRSEPESLLEVVELALRALR